MMPIRKTPILDGSAGIASPLGVAISQGDRATMSMVRDAITARRLRLAYQPVVLGRDTGRIAFYEGLIRVLDPKIGERIYDGACGSAGFLCEAYDHLLPQASAQPPQAKPVPIKRSNEIHSPQG